MEESEEKVNIKTLDSSLALQNLYKTASNEIYEMKTDDETRTLLAIKPLSYVGQDCYINSEQISSNGTFESVGNVLDLDKGISVQIINRDLTSYSGDSDLLQKLLQENGLVKQDQNSSLITILDINGPLQSELNNFINVKREKDVADTGTKNLNIDDCDFNSSDSFASTESIIPKEIKCPKCPKQFMFKSDLLRHDKHKHKKKMLPCPFCNKEFSCKQNLSFHEKSRSCQESICSLCNKSFKNRVMLSKHLNHSHKDSPLHKCTVCPKSFLCPERLKEHLSKYHFDGVAFPCSVCQRTFRVKRSLQVHLKKHLHFNCQFCSEKFYDNLRFKEHLQTHTESVATNVMPSEELDSKPYKCQQCPKAYVNKYSYKCHVLKHSTPKVCKVCNESFDDEKELQSHSRLHTFDCNVCSRTFSTTASLTRHFKRKHTILEQDTFTQTEDEMFQMQNINVFVDPSSAGSESFVLATSINGLGSLPIFISQPLNGTFSVSPTER